MRWDMDTAGAQDQVTEEFTLLGLRRVRELLARVAGKAGVPADRIDVLVWAANEVATNAVVHGGGRGRITITAAEGGVRVAVTEWGPGFAGPSADGPPLDATDGCGLGLTRQLYPGMIVTAGPAGTTVTVFAAC
jgi:anti-sigma regulatory factor (Ser/Thr protein kinase)